MTPADDNKTSDKPDFASSADRIVPTKVWSWEYPESVFHCNVCGAKVTAKQADKDACPKCGATES